MNLSLVVPCYNEEGNVKNLIEKCEKFLSNQKHELILVNNGSTDNTEKKIDEFLNIPNIKKVNVNSNKGFGYGVLQGLLAASGDILSYTHADNQTDPNDVLKGLELLKDKNNSNFLIKGNRINKIKYNWTLFELFVSYAMTIFETILFQKLLYDIHGQPVIFHKNFLKIWKSSPNDMALDLYVYYLAVINKYKIIRFPVKFDKKNRLTGRGNTDALTKIFKEMILQIISSIILRFNIK